MVVCCWRAPPPPACRPYMECHIWNAGTQRARLGLQLAHAIGACWQHLQHGAQCTVRANLLQGRGSLSTSCDHAAPDWTRPRRQAWGVEGAGAPGLDRAHVCRSLTCGPEALAMAAGAKLDRATHVRSVTCIGGASRQARVHSGCHTGVTRTRSSRRGFQCMYSGLNPWILCSASSSAQAGVAPRPPAAGRVPPRSAP